jgi:hypothetical protein
MRQPNKAGMTDVVQTQRPATEIGIHRAADLVIQRQTVLAELAGALDRVVDRR